MRNLFPPRTGPRDRAHPHSAARRTPLPARVVYTRAHVAIARTRNKRGDTRSAYPPPYRRALRKDNEHERNDALLALRTLIDVHELDVDAEAVLADAVAAHTERMDKDKARRRTTTRAMRPRPSTSAWYSAISVMTIAPAAGRSAPRWAGQGDTIRNDDAPIGRNAPCPCGSGKKHKKCCGK